MDKITLRVGSDGTLIKPNPQGTNYVNAIELTRQILLALGIPFDWYQQEYFQCLLSYLAQWFKGEKDDSWLVSRKNRGTLIATEYSNPKDYFRTSDLNEFKRLLDLVVEDYRHR